MKAKAKGGAFHRSFLTGRVVTVVSSSCVVASGPGFHGRCGCKAVGFSLIETPWVVASLW